MRYILIPFACLASLSLTAHTEANYQCWLINEKQQVIPLSKEANEQSLATYVSFDFLSGVSAILKIDRRSPTGTFSIQETDTSTSRLLQDLRKFGPWNKLEAPEYSISHSGFAGEYSCSFGKIADFATLKPSRRATLYSENPDWFYEERANLFKRRGLIDDYFVGPADKRKQITIDASTLILITHPEDKFDQGRTQKDFDLFFSSLESHKAPVVTLTSSLIFNELTSNVEKRYLSSIIHSQNGAHSFLLPNARTVLLAGGFLEQCLCDTFKGILRGSQNDIEIILPLELVYFQIWKPITDVFFDDSDPNLSKGDAITLRELERKSLSFDSYANQLWQAFKTHILGNNEFDIQGAVCPHQPDGEILLDRFTINAFLEDEKTGAQTKKIGTLGRGQQRISVVFSSMTLAKQRLARSAGL